MPFPARWAAAAAAVLALVAALLLRRREPPPALYRVDPGVPAIDAALWLVDRYPGYFDGVEGDEFAAFSAQVPAHERAFVLSLAHHLAWVWVEREAAAIFREAGGAENLSLGTLGRAATRRIRDQTLNQLEISIHDGLERTAANIDEPHYLGGVFSRLVRGLSNCEGQNHFLLLIVDAILGPRGARVAWTRTAEHTLVEVTMPGASAPIYFDAWSNLPPYVLADRSDDPSVLTHAAIVADQPFVVPGRRGRIHERPDRLHSAGRPWERLVHPRELPPWPGPPPAGIEIRRPVIDLARARTTDDIRRLFFAARVLHLFGEIEAAIPIYQVIDARCPDHPPGDDYVCPSTRLYLDYLGATRRPIAP